METSINYGMGIVCFPKSIEVNQDLVIPYFASLKERALKDDYTIVLEDGAQLGILGRLGALVVPVDGLQLLHQRNDGAMLVDDIGSQLGGIFVQ